MLDVVNYTFSSSTLLLTWVHSNRIPAQFLSLLLSLLASALQHSYHLLAFGTHFYGTQTKAKQKKNPSIQHEIQRNLQNETNDRELSAVFSLSLFSLIFILVWLVCVISYIYQIAIQPYYNI